jgi:hypothetical protein
LLLGTNFFAGGFAFSRFAAFALRFLRGFGTVRSGRFTFACNSHRIAFVFLM